MASDIGRRKSISLRIARTLLSIEVWESKPDKDEESLRKLATAIRAKVCHA
jgi:hypothetical protein